MCQVQCKAAFLPVTKAIPRLAEACAALEADAIATLEWLRSEASVLQRSQVGTVAQLRAEREGLIELMREELTEMEEGTNYSMNQLMAVLGKEREELRASKARCASVLMERDEMVATRDSRIAALQKELLRERAANEVAAAQAKKVRTVLLCSNFSHTESRSSPQPPHQPPHECSFTRRT